MLWEREGGKKSSSQREISKYEMDRGCRTRKQRGGVSKMMSEEGPVNQPSAGHPSPNLFIFLLKVIRARTTTCFIDQTKKLLRAKGDAINYYIGTTGLNWHLTGKTRAHKHPEAPNRSTSGFSSCEKI